MPVRDWPLPADVPPNVDNGAVRRRGMYLGAGVGLCYNVVMDPCHLEYEPLVAALRTRGIRFLAPSDARTGPEPISDRDLIECLASHEHPRLRLALAALFLLHPDLASQLGELDLPGAAQTELHVQYTAAACLQRMWSIRLGFYLGEFPLLPDLYSASLGLPPVDAHYGKLCLHTLAARQPFDQLPAYDGLMNLLFAQLKAEAFHEHAPTG